MKETIIRRVEIAVCLLPIAVAVVVAYTKTKEIPAIQTDIVALQISQAKAQTSQDNLKELIIDVRSDVKEIRNALRRSRQ